MRTELKTAPAGYPITLAQVKEIAFVNTDKHDSNITALIPAVVSFVERYTQLKLVNQSWYIYYDLPELQNVMNLATFNCSAITELLTYDNDNDSSVVTSSDYRLSGDNKLIFNSSVSFSGTYRNFDSMRAEVVAGYGADESAIPYQLKSALAEIVYHWVQNSKPASKDKYYEIPISAQVKLKQYRRSNHWL